MPIGCLATNFNMLNLQYQLIPQRSNSRSYRFLMPSFHCMIASNIFLEPALLSRKLCLQEASSGVPLTFSAAPHDFRRAGRTHVNIQREVPTKTRGLLDYLRIARHRCRPMLHNWSRGSRSDSGKRRRFQVVCFLHGRGKSNELLQRRFSS